MYKDGLHEHSRLEEEYFYKKERELIEKNKKEAAQKRELLERTSHYHKCAKCGHDMNEVTKDGVSLLACRSCESIHISLESLNSLSQHGQLKSLASDARELMIEWKKSA